MFYATIICMLSDKYIYSPKIENSLFIAHKKLVSSK